MCGCDVVPIERRIEHLFVAFFEAVAFDGFLLFVDNDQRRCLYWTEQDVISRFCMQTKNVRTIEARPWHNPAPRVDHASKLVER